MRKIVLKTAVSVIAIALTAALWSPLTPKAHAFSGGGAGINFDPYQITNCDQLQEMNNDLSAHYTLLNDINCSATSGWNSGAGFMPVGSDSTPFTGRLLGQSHTITGLYINRPNVDQIGLFGVLNGDVYQISIRGATINGGSNNYTGVLAGEARSSAHVVLSSAAGTLDGFWFAGGLVGKNAGVIEDSFANVSVDSIASRVGGFAGDNSGTITNSYSRGAVQPSAGDYGGFIGYNSGDGVGNSFWDTTASGQASSAAGTGKSTTEMKDIATYTSLLTSGLSSAWDFVGTVNDDVATNENWVLDSTRNNGYPYINGQQYAVDEPDTPAPIFNGGDGTEGSPYQIGNCEQLQSISLDLSAHYELSGNVDCSMTNPTSLSFDNAGTWSDQKGFVPIGEDQDGQRFLGTLNGNNHYISDLYIERPDENTTGLFGTVGLGSTVSNVELVNVDITGKQAVGAVGGVVYGTVSNCSSDGHVEGESEVGGLVGGHNGWDTVEDSHSDAQVVGSNNVGGLVGTNRGNIYRSYATGEVFSIGQAGGLVGVTDEDTTIDQSFATGNVTGEDYIGGLVGSGTNTTVSNSYATGNVDGVSNLGGLIGATDWSYIVGNYATGTVTSSATSDAYIGGLGGFLLFTYVHNNHSSSAVSAPDAIYVGGLVGAGVIDVEYSYATGAITGGTTVGGLVGGLDCQGAHVEAAFSTGAVTAFDVAGGFAGSTTGGCSILNSYTRSSVSSYELAGGFSGLSMEATYITNAYAANTVSSNDDLGQDFIGMYNSETVGVTNSFYDMDLNGLGDTSPAVGKSTTAMKNLDTFTTELGEGSWDFENIWDIDPTVNSGYPCLLWDEGGCVDGSPFTQGDGSVQSPYIINTCQQLQAMQSDLAAHYALGSNIDCSNTVVWNGGRGFNPVGDDNDPFTGTLEGNEYTISDLFIQRADDSYYENEGDEYFVGLFGYVENSEVQNLTLTNAKVKGYRYVGGIAGYAKNSNLHDINFNVELADNTCAPGRCVWARWGEYGGGIAGVADNSTLTNLSTGGPVKGSGVTIGGIVGEARNGSEISHVMSVSNVDGGYHIGGLVGALYNSSLAHASASGFVHLVYDDGYKLGTAGGGAVGYAESSTIDDVEASGNVVGWSILGGLVGNIQDTTVNNSTASGDVDGQYTLGGLLGAASAGSIEDSIAFGDVANAHNEIGGFIGEASNTSVLSSAAFGDVQGAEDSASVGGFVGYSICGSEFTSSNAHGAVSGGSDVGGFTGIDACEGPASSFNESFATGDVYSTGDYTGGFAGRALASNILRAYATGDVYGGRDYSGGLVGLEWSWRPSAEEVVGTITESFATGHVYGDRDDAGGLVGTMYDGYVEDSYARGDVEVGMRAGGLIGNALGTQDEIISSYSTGMPMAGMAMGGLIAEFDSYPENHRVVNSFWDEDTSIASSAQSLGTKKSTAAMNDATTFTNAGWDTQNIWGLNPSVNNSYPCLRWSNEDCVLTIIDSDGDGVSDAVENSRPNNGDTNSDGIPDSVQDNVVALDSQVTGKVVVLELGQTCEIQTASVADTSGFSKKDTNYNYADGMVHFVADCGAPGVTTLVNQYYYDKSDPNALVRKYNNNTQTYSTIDGALISTTNIDGHQITKLTYNITDGSSLDEDSAENGTIIDPSGLATATKSSAGLSGTGMNTTVLLATALLLVTGSTIVFVRIRDRQLRQLV